MDTEYFLEILYSYYCRSYSNRLPFGTRLEDELLTLRMEMEKIPEEQREPLQAAAEHARQMTGQYCFAQGLRFASQLLHATLR